MKKFRHIFFLRTYNQPSRRASMIYILAMYVLMHVHIFSDTHRSVM